MTSNEWNVTNFNAVSKWSKLWLTMLKVLNLNKSGVGGVKVSIVAFQAIDPGSIPG